MILTGGKGRIALNQNKPPCHKLSSAFGTSPLFKIHDSLEETDQVIVCCIIELLKGIKPFRKVRSEVWGIIVSQRPLVQMKDVFFIVGKTRNFLRCSKPCTQSVRHSTHFGPPDYCAAAYESAHGLNGKATHSCQRTSGLSN